MISPAMAHGEGKFVPREQAILQGSCEITTRSRFATSTRRATAARTRLIQRQRDDIAGLCDQAAGCLA